MGGRRVVMDEFHTDATVLLALPNSTARRALVEAIAARQALDAMAEDAASRPRGHYRLAADARPPRASPSYAALREWFARNLEVELAVLMRGLQKAEVQAEDGEVVGHIAGEKGRSVEEGEARVMAASAQTSPQTSAHALAHALARTNDHSQAQALHGGKDQEEVPRGGREGLHEGARSLLLGLLCASAPTVVEGHVMAGWQKAEKTEETRGGDGKLTLWGPGRWAELVEMADAVSAAAKASEPL